MYKGRIKRKEDAIKRTEAQLEIYEQKLVPDMTSSHTPNVVCNDGFEMSVQAGQSLYSEPRDVADSYEEAEVGFPSTEESLLTSYAEDGEALCDTVYGYVPCSIIDEVIEKHGGIDEEAIVKMK